MKSPGPFPNRHAIGGEDDDHPKEECGLFGIYGLADAAALTVLGLHALQHRGQEAAGIVAYDGKQFHIHRALGEVGDNFNAPEIIGRLEGHMAIGHVRYSTTGETVLRNVQPLFADFKFGGLAVAHNGNLTNAYQVHQELVQRGCIFQSTTDTEIIIHLIAISEYGRLVDRMTDALSQVQGAYSLVAMTQKKLIGLRDPHGVRPLVLGRLGEAWILASETCALDIIDAEFVRDVEPGEIVIIDEKGLHSLKPFAKVRNRFCIFEYIYFARPDSILAGQLVHSVRQELGAQLAREHPVDADMVIGIPDSSTAAAVGYAQESGIPYSEGLVKNRYVGRTFIEPEQRLRDLGVRQKFNPLTEVIKGKRLVVVDDSIVRGTTTPHVVSLLRRAGAAEIHMRVCAPPIKNPCYMGVDMASRQELIAANQSVEEICQTIGADTLGFLPVDGLMKVVGGTRGGFCDACFTGNYPVPVQLELTKLVLEENGSGTLD